MSKVDARLHHGVGRWFVLAAAALFALLMLAPFVIIAMNAFTSPTDYSQNGPLGLPTEQGNEARDQAVRGAMQLPPSGQPVIFGPDHPTTGGYPVIAVLTEAASDRLVQCRPGDLVTLVWSSPPPSCQTHGTLWRPEILTSRLVDRRPPGERTEVADAFGGNGDG